MSLIAPDDDPLYVAGAIIFLILVALLWFLLEMH
jgi:hypothetical protein